MPPEQQLLTTRHSVTPSHAMKCQNKVKQPETPTLLLTPLVSPPTFVDYFQFVSFNVGSERLHYIIDRTKMGYRVGETDTTSPLFPPPPGCAT